ncbi:hypothetical protein [Halococcoides cellulosivorans]|uniref:Uncharacterized protein n=1 Tax=Halococcoides cellulosivorans TaxID=1679096 RepID=A0A2R4X053_9EURY|nr:hypothetical protein [Halococcoides cellulosivorans]AWB27182.1 hypothetical protein HARCEL1_05420 [Halococcoides cellulosivorans]
MALSPTALATDLRTMDPRFQIAGLVPIVGSALIAAWALTNDDLVTALTVPIWALAGVILLAIGRTEADR